ncbi:MAG: carboxylesterase family protein [Bacteroidales bacterium]|nr:carboxylesterase family protein [Bacteroidales bacterium]
MKVLKPALILLFLTLSAAICAAQETYLFDVKDGQSLYLDVYRPTEGADTTFQGHNKPIVMFVFGGGFIQGNRSEKFYLPWYKLLNDDGYTLVSIDYRLGMKGYKMGKGLAGAYRDCKQFLASQQMGVEDVFSAVSYLNDNAEELRLNASDIVLSGSSAGAIISLASEYAILRGETEGLPEGFNFRGIMSFAGAVISITGAPDYPAAPCPTLMFHGTADRAVAYDHYGAFGRGLWGSSFISKQFRKKGYNHSIYRFTKRTHDVAGYMEAMWEKEKEFLEQDVILGNVRSIDMTIDDPSLPTWGDISIGDIY